MNDVPHEDPQHPGDRIIDLCERTAKTELLIGDVRESLDTIKKSIDGLNHWKSKIHGGAIVAGALAGLILALGMAFFAGLKGAVETQAGSIESLRSSTEELARSLEQIKGRLDGMEKIASLSPDLPAASFVLTIGEPSSDATHVRFCSFVHVTTYGDQSISYTVFDLSQSLPKMASEEESNRLARAEQDRIRAAFAMFNADTPHMEMTQRLGMKQDSIVVVEQGGAEAIAKFREHFPNADVFRGQPQFSFVPRNLDDALGDLLVLSFTKPNCFGTPTEAYPPPVVDPVSRKDDSVPTPHGT